MKKLTVTLVGLLLACAVWSQTARVQIIHNSPTPTVDIYANTDKLLDNFAFRTATPYIDVPAGVNINIGVALASSNSSSDAIANFPVQFMSGKTYVVVAAGVVGGAQPFNLFVYDMGAETSNAANNVGILFFHGSPDAPEVDVATGGSVLYDNVSFGEFSGYLNVPAASYQLDVTPANDNSTIVASYDADLSFWKGRTAVVFASGFLSGANPAFEPWVALDNGGTFPLPLADNFNGGGTGSKALSATSAPSVTASVFPNPATNYLNLNLENDQEAEIAYSIFDLTGRVVLRNELGLQPVGRQTVEIDINDLNNGTYFMKIEKGNGVQTARFQVIK